MIVTTGNEVAGQTIIEYLGVARGTALWSLSIMQALGNIVNSETYLRACEDARQLALDRMEEDALDRGADAVIAVRFSTTPILQGKTEMLAYGTAVKLG